MTVSYDYGKAHYKVRTLSVFNELGSKVACQVAEDASGSRKMNVDNRSPGIYIIRMEGDGAALQTQRVVVSPH